MRVRRVHILVLLLGLAVCLIPFRAKIRSTAVSAIQVLKGKKSVAERVAEFGDGVHQRLAPRFKEVGVAYPPKRIRLVGLKQERMLEVWVANEGGDFEYLISYPILAASGTLGPKLVEGDGQVPEGLYRIESLNPNSLYHLALRIDYPNGFDKAKATADGRTNPGSDIMIHGKSASIGCLAMGDQVAENLFVLAAETGIRGVEVILSPVDFRKRSLPSNLSGMPPWTPDLYSDIQKELLKLKRQPDGAANGSQPVRAQTNQTSAAAGSGR